MRDAAVDVEGLIAAYADADTACAWRRLLDDPDKPTGPVAALEFVRLRSDPDARPNYDHFVDVLSGAVASVGGEMTSVNDTLMPGLNGLEGYAGGISWAAVFPSADAFLSALDQAPVRAVARFRRTSVEEAQLLLGPNLVPEAVRRLPPNTPASAFPNQRVHGKTPGEIVRDLLAVYPSGGADPTREVLEALVAFDGFAHQRLTFINLYRLDSSNASGAAALAEYGAKAGPIALAHGARPAVAANVTHHLSGSVGWSRFVVVTWPSFEVFTDLRLDPAYIEEQRNRVVSAVQYGNLITIARTDNSRA